MTTRIKVVLCPTICEAQWSVQVQREFSTPFTQRYKFKQICKNHKKDLRRELHFKGKNTGRPRMPDENVQHSLGTLENLQQKASIIFALPRNI